MSWICNVNNNSIKTRLLFFGFSFFWIIVCGNTQKRSSTNDYVVFSGEVLNVTHPVIKIFSQSVVFKKTIKITTNTFKDTLYIEKEGYFTLIIDKKRTSFYLKNGDNLHLSIDMDVFPESISYEGRGALINDYLWEKRLLQRRKAKKSLDKQMIEPNVFKNRLEKSRYDKDELLNKYIGLDSEFRTNEKRYNQYDYLLELSNYYVNFYSNKKEIPSDFLKEIEMIDFDNQVDFDSYSNYALLCVKRFSLLLQKRSDNGRYNKQFFVDEINKIKSDKIKNVIIKNIIKSEIDIYNPNLFHTYDLLAQVIDDKDLTSKISKYIEKVKQLERGKISPTFSYQDTKSNVVKLNDFKGKYLYIDVWATWCNPCLKETPYYNELRKKYQNKNIEFISISIDKQKDINLWKNTIIDKNFSGMHLIANEGFTSKFIEDYAIDSVPRYILIDPKGRIFDATAPSPSDQDLIVLFENLGIESNQN